MSLFKPVYRTPFDEGAFAKKIGRTWFACPYSDSERKRQWFAGYDSAPFRGWGRCDVDSKEPDQ